MEGWRTVKIMAYGINSSIQAVKLTDDVGAVLGQKSLSIPLTARTITISSMCPFALAFSYEDLFIKENRMLLPSQFGDLGTGTQPITIPAPCGTNGQLWVVAFDELGDPLRPESYLSLMVLE